MEIVVFSSATKMRSELDSVIKMFDEGLETFHIRKTKFSKKELKEYIESIPKHYHKRLILHTNYSLVRKYDLKGLHLKKKYRKNSFKRTLRIMKYRFLYKGYSISTSFHSLSSIEYAKKFDYSTISPVFESISKKGYAPPFTLSAIKYELNVLDANIYALGGIDAHNALEAKKLGFKGVVLMGVLWNTDSNPVDVFKSVHRVLNQGDSLVHKLKIEPVKITL